MKEFICVEGRAPAQPRNLPHRDERAVVDFRELFAYTIRGQPYSRCCELFEVSVHKAATAAAALAPSPGTLLSRPRVQFF